MQEGKHSREREKGIALGMSLAWAFAFTIHLILTTMTVETDSSDVSGLNEVLMITYAVLAVVFGTIGGCDFR
jgi:hypothetical protein